MASTTMTYQTLKLTKLHQMKCLNVEKRHPETEVFTITVQDEIIDTLNYR